MSRFLLLVRSYPSETGRLRERFASFDMKPLAFPRGDLREGLVEHALDIHTRRRVDIVWAQQEYDPLLNDQDPRHRRFLCAACCRGMHVVRPAHESGKPHFAHHHGAICNAVEAGRLRYDQLRDQGEQDQVERLKAEFVERWPWVFKRLNAIVGNLYFKEFIRILDTSTQRRVWGYRNLDVRQLPYVFAFVIDSRKVGTFPGERDIGASGCCQVVLVIIGCGPSKPHSFAVESSLHLATGIFQEPAIF